MPIFRHHTLSLTGAVAALSILTSARVGFAAEPRQDSAESAPSASDATPSPAEPASAEQSDKEAPPPKEQAEPRPAAKPAQPKPVAKAQAAVAAPPPASAAGAEAKPEEAAPPASPFGVERLRPEAYPNDPVRGIRGGSLAWTFHGLQWPYMPAPTGAPRLTLGFSGWAWVDSAYEVIVPGPTTPNKRIKYWLQQGRFVLRATPTYSRGDWFIQSQLEVVGNADQSSTRNAAPDTDDLWVRVGMWNKFDLQFGRYEAWEIFHLGMGLDLNTFERRGAVSEQDNPSSLDFYGVTDNYYRPSGAGNVALHVYPFRFLRFEMLGQMGHVAPNNTLGARPTAVLDFGWLKLKGGVEYQKQTARVESPYERTAQGAGGAIQFVFAPWVEFGFNVAQGKTDVTTSAGAHDEEASVSRTSYGGFINGQPIEDLVIGLGAIQTNIEDIHLDPQNRVGEYYHFQGFAAIQYALFKQLYIKAVVATAKARWAPSFTESLPYTNIMDSARLRLSYYF